MGRGVSCMRWYQSLYSLSPPPPPVGAASFSLPDGMILLANLILSVYKFYSQTNYYLIHATVSCSVTCYPEENSADTILLKQPVFASSWNYFIEGGGRMKFSHICLPRTPNWYSKCITGWIFLPWNFFQNLCS